MKTIGTLGLNKWKRMKVYCFSCYTIVADLALPFAFLSNAHTQTHKILSSWNVLILH